jgi:hypothetical protein
MYNIIIDIAKTENIIGEIGRAIDNKIEKTPTICISLKLCTDIKLRLTVFLSQTSSIFKKQATGDFEIFSGFETDKSVNDLQDS